ncbi:hypothetical protein EYF80_014306 [Liparis tanakae]|uniref:Uncharacterized protein n=1 Tax=Liparis tanakae TaxID=230148 RepID=A0A4Z2IDM5_9TELE|nr:hypothetical protein EYF80_014306 [Liparis tanakae]
MSLSDRGISPVSSAAAEVSRLVSVSVSGPRGPSFCQGATKRSVSRVSEMKIPEVQNKWVRKRQEDMTCHETEPQKTQHTVYTQGGELQRCKKKAPGPGGPLEVGYRRRTSVSRESLKWLLKVSMLELNQAQQTVDRLAVGWLGSKAAAC